MEYSVNKLSKLSGVSARTLRYYDEIGLLKPSRVASSGYRIYSQTQVSKLQQILFYRELGFSLEDIKALVDAPDFDASKAFENHLAALNQKRERLDALINNVTKSLAAMKGELKMTDKEKFEGFKQSLINENERKYGEEIREKYGDAEVNASNEKLMGLSKEQYDESVRLNDGFEKAIKAAIAKGDPRCEEAMEACDLHRRWLCVFYPNYSAQYHVGLGEMYVADERFKEHYEKIATGCAEFLRDAIKHYCADRA